MGNKKTKKTFLKESKDVNEKCKMVNKKIVSYPFDFDTIKDAEIYFRQLGGVTIEEFMNKMRDEYGI